MPRTAMMRSGGTRYPARLLDHPSHQRGGHPPYSVFQGQTVAYVQPGADSHSCRKADSVVLSCAGAGHLQHHHRTSSSDLDTGSSGRMSSGSAPDCACHCQTLTLNPLGAGHSQHYHRTSSSDLDTGSSGRLSSGSAPDPLPMQLPPRQLFTCTVGRNRSQARCAHLPAFRA